MFQFPTTLSPHIAQTSTYHQQANHRLESHPSHSILVTAILNTAQYSQPHSGHPHHFNLKPDHPPKKLYHCNHSHLTTTILNTTILITNFLVILNGPHRNYNNPIGIIFFTILITVIFSQSSSYYQRTSVLRLFFGCIKTHNGVN